MKLTELSIKRLPIPETGQKTYWEQGFGVRISQGGTRSFVAKIDNKLITIGRYPAITLKHARQEFLRLKTTNATPSPQTPLRTAREAFLADCATRLRPKTLNQYRHYLNLVDVETVGDVTYFDISGNIPHMVASWKVFMNWCLHHGYVEKNPFALTKVTYGSRSRFLDNSELKAIWAYDYPPYSDYIKLSILTGQRIGQWQDYTLSDDAITFPDSVMKGKLEHTIPLLPMAAELLPIAPFNGWSRAKARLDKHVILPHWRVHDLRRTFSTIMASLQVPLHVTEYILAHRSGSISGVAATYNRYNYQREMRDALKIYEDHIRSIVA